MSARTALSVASPAESALPSSVGRRAGGPAGGLTVCPGAGRWVIDAASSTLRISVKVGFLATVVGRFTEVSGRIDVTGDVLGSRIAVAVRTASLTSGSSRWDTLLLSAGLVDSVANPTIAFESSELAVCGTGWRLSGLLVTERGCLPMCFDLSCVDTGVADRMRFRATGALASKDAVRLLSQPGVERLVGPTMTVDLVIEATRG